MAPACIMPQIGSRSARWEGGGKKATRHEQHIKHILKKETGGMVGRGGGGGRNNCLLPPPLPRSPPSPPHEATGWLGLRPLPCCSLQSAGVTKTICVSPDRFLPSLPCQAALFCFFASYFPKSITGGLPYVSVIGG